MLPLSGRAALVRMYSLSSPCFLLSVLTSCPEVVIYLVSHGSCPPPVTQSSFVHTGKLPLNHHRCRTAHTAFYLPTDRPLPCENIFLHCTQFSENCANTQLHNHINLLLKHNIHINYLAASIKITHNITDCFQPIKTWNKTLVNSTVWLCSCSQPKLYCVGHWFAQLKKLKLLTRHSAMQQLTWLSTPNEQKRAIREQIAAYIFDQAIKPWPNSCPVTRQSCAAA